MHQSEIQATSKCVDLVLETPIKTDHEPRWNINYLWFQGKAKGDQKGATKDVDESNFRVEPFSFPDGMAFHTYSFFIKW